MGSDPIWQSGRWKGWGGIMLRHHWEYQGPPHHLLTADQVRDLASEESDPTAHGHGVVVGGPSPRYPQAPES